MDVEVVEKSIPIVSYNELNAYHRTMASGLIFEGEEDEKVFVIIGGAVYNIGAFEQEPKESKYDLCYTPLNIGGIQGEPKHILIKYEENYVVSAYFAHASRIGSTV